MKVGIKFCGGCNSTYDRGKEVEKLKEQFPDIEWVFGNSKMVCDRWLLICGCFRKCPKTETYAAKEEVVTLCHPKDFDKVITRWKEEKRSEKIFEKRTISIGERAAITKKITKEDVALFANVTLDDNKLHVDSAFAARHPFRKPAAHGMLTLSLLSAVMGTKLPGDGTILMGCESKFLKPVYPGESVTAEVVLKQCRDLGEHYIAKLRGICTNGRGETVTEMTAYQMLQKEFFILQEIPQGRI